ncbi:nSTAND1 domain-containing NTPase [Streptomyces chrestomyceticus]
MAGIAGGGQHKPRLGRPERPVDPQAGPVERLAWELRRLRQRAGTPSYRTLAKTAHYSASTLAEAAKGERLPTLDVVLAYAQACGGDRAEWEARWRAAAGAGGDEPVTARCPYPGLAAFEAANAAEYFGRATLTKELSGRVEQHALTVVFGASGSGKSSLLRAGLLPHLGAHWHPVLLTPGARPLTALAAAVARLVAEPGQPGGAPAAGTVPAVGEAAAAVGAAGEGTGEAAGEGEDGGDTDGDTDEQARTDERPTPDPEAPTPDPPPPEDPATPLRRSLDDDPAALDLALRTWLAARPDTTRALLVVDQFEEVFTLCADEAERTAFLGAVAALARSDDRRIRLAVGIRADFYARCFVHPGLVAVLRTAGQLPVGPPSRAELRDIIAEPAVRSGVQVDADLVEAVLAEAAGQPGALPLVGHAMRETWQRRSGDTLRLADYRATGGMRGAVAQTAERMYEAAAPRQRNVMRAVFLRLTALGEGTEDTRRRLARRELDGLAEPQEIDGLLRKLAAARLVVLSDGKVEVAHEAVIRAWPRLRHWLDEDREALRTHRRLTAAAEAWHELGRDAGALYRGAQLAGAQAWERVHGAALNALERDFLRSATGADRRRGRRARWLTASLGALLVLALIAAGIAFEQRADAEAQRRIAVSRQYAAEAAELRREQPQAAALTALYGYRQAPTVEARGSLLSAYGAFRANQFTGHTGVVTAVAFSPDGRTLATGSVDRTVKLWDTATDRLRGTFIGHIGPVYALAFSPDGRYLATAGDDTTVRLWDVPNRRLLGVLNGPSGRVMSLSFSQDSRTLASGSTGDAVRLWDVASRRRAADLTGHQGNVTAVAFSPDGKVLASAGDDRTVRLWDARTRRPLATLTGHVQPVFALAFSPDGRSLASGGGDRTVRLWDVAGRRKTGELTGTADRITALAWSPDRRTLAVGSYDGIVRLWDVNRRHAREKFTARVESASALSFARNGTALAAPADDDTGTVRLWRIAGHGRERLGGRQGGITSVAVSPDGRTIAAAGSRLTLWSADRPQPLRSLDAPPGVITSLVFSPHGDVFASVHADRTVRLWDVRSGRLLAELRGHTGTVREAAFSKDGKRLATVGDDRHLFLWDVASHRRTAARQLFGNGSTVTFAPDGRTLAVTENAGNRGVVRLWDAATLEETARFTGRSYPVFAAAFADDGKTLATSGTDHDILLWDVPGRRLAGTLRGHSSSVASLAFSPDSRFLASGGDDDTVRLWDVGARSTTAVLSGHSGSVLSLSYWPNGRSLVSGSADGTVREWSVDVGETARSICRLSREGHWAQTARGVPADWYCR